MTPYQVIMSPMAHRQLAAIWIASSNRAEITQTEERIYQALTNDPKSAAREITPGFWLIQDPPLRIYFEINDVHKIIRITDVFSP